MAKKKPEETAAQPPVPESTFEPIAEGVDPAPLEREFEPVEGASDGQPPAPEPPDRMLQWFRHGHLPPKLADVSKPFCDLAAHIVKTLPRNAERTVALRKLLEGKDAAVRSLLEE